MGNGWMLEWISRSQDPSVMPVLFADIFILACLLHEYGGRFEAGKPNFLTDKLKN
jgi:hypothetical protein